MPNHSPLIHDENKMAYHTLTQSLRSPENCLNTYSTDTPKVFGHPMQWALGVDFMREGGNSCHGGYGIHVEWYMLDTTLA